MKIKTSELTGAALDWAVAKCEGHDAHCYNGVVYTTMHKRLGPECHYSTDWSQGGLIIEREGIRLHRSVTGDWWASPESDPHRPVSGPTPLIAAMRCFVVDKFGGEVEVPEEIE